MRLRRALGWAFVVVLIMLCLWIAFVDFGGPEIVAYATSSPSKKQLSFHFERCDRRSGHGPGGEPSVRWDRGTALVAAVVESNCGTSWLFGEYSVRHGTINLSYQAIVPRYVLCDCPHRVTYRIEGIPPGDYQVHLTGRPEIHARPAWLRNLVGQMLGYEAFVAGLMQLFAAAACFAVLAALPRGRPRTRLAVLGATSGAALYWTIMASMYLLGSPYYEMSPIYLSDFTTLIFILLLPVALPAVGFAVAMTLADRKP